MVSFRLKIDAASIDQSLHVLLRVIRDIKCSLRPAQDFPIRTQK